MKDLLLALEYLAARYGWAPATVALIYYLDCNWIQGILVALITYFAAKGNYIAGYSVCWSKYNDPFEDKSTEEC